MPGRPRIERDAAAGDQARAIHEPLGDGAVFILPENVGLAVAVEIARTDLVPVRSRIAADARPRDETGAVGQPDRRRAVGVLPQDIAVAIAVEIIRRWLWRW